MPHIPPPPPPLHARLLHFHTFLLVLLLLIFPRLTSSSMPLPISPRFLHFSLQIRPEWLMDTENRLLAVLESAEEGPKSWQLAIQLFANQPNQGMPFSTLLNVTQGRKPVNADGMEECRADGTKTIRLEIELSPQFIYIRAKNAAKYALPSVLVGSADLRVFFVRIGENGSGQGERGSKCQLNSEMEAKETSRFALPSTTPHPAITSTSTSASSSSGTSSTTAVSQVTAPTPSTTTITSTNAVVVVDDVQQKGGNTNGSLPTKKITPWPAYKRKRIKVPRRSTMAAQRFLGPNHYVPQQDWARGRQQQRMFPPPRVTRPTPGGWPPYGGVATTTQASYIDIIRDRQLYEEVQRSRTMEINSRWSFTFLLFMGLIAVLISMSAAFALVMFVLLQCRPKPKRFQPTTWASPKM